MFNVLINSFLGPIRGDVFLPSTVGPVLGLAAVRLAGRQAGRLSGRLASRQAGRVCICMYVYVCIYIYIYAYYIH